MKLFLSAILALLASVILALPASAAVVTMQDFNNPIVTGPTQAPGTYYTDRYAPSGFQTSGGELVMTISSADSQANRPGAFSGAFYNTQGRKYDLGAGATTLSVDLFLDSNWVGSGQRQAGLWATAFDPANAISFFPIAEYFDTGWRGWDGVGGWISLGAGNAGVYNTIGFVLNETLNQWEYQLNGVFAGAVAANGSDYIGNAILQGYNNYGPNDQGRRDVRFDNLIATDGENRVPEPTSLALVGFSLVALGTITSRRRRQSIVGAPA